jgi:hypothetical protein
MIESSPLRVVAVVIAVSLLTTACASRSPAPLRSPEPAEPAAGTQSVAEPAPAAAPETPTSDKSAATPNEGASLPRSAVPTLGSKDEVEVLGDKLDGALGLSTPDCGTAWALRDRICDLTQRICDLAARSAEQDVAERCTDGRARCEHATSRVRAVCAE